MEKSQEVNLIKLKLGFLLYNTGGNWIRESFKAERTKVNKPTIRNFIAEQLGLRHNQFSLHDQNYFLTDWNAWKPIIDYDILDTIVALDDIFDCDNTSFLFSARAAFLYGLNAFKLSGSLYSPTTGNFLGRHGFNGIVTVNEDKQMELRIYEAMVDGECLVERGKPVIIKKDPIHWRYITDWVTGF